MTQTVPNTSTYTAQSIELSGVVWLDTTRRTDGPQPQLKGPHFPIPRTDWEEFEGWTCEQAWLGNAPSEIAKPTVSYSPPKIDEPLPTISVPTPHLNWRHSTKLQTVGKQWSGWQVMPAGVNRESTSKTVVQWPEITDRILSMARESLVELATTLLPINSRVGENVSKSNRPSDNATTAPSLALTSKTRVLVAGNAPDIGATSTAIALGRYLAQEGLRVLLIDADLVTAGLSRCLGLLGAIDSDYSLASQVGSLQRRLIQAEVGSGKLDILPTCCRPLALANAMQSALDLIKWVREHRSNYDITIIDTGPMIEHAGQPSVERFQPWIQFADVGLVVRRPLDKRLSSSPPIEPDLATWGLRRLVIANIIPSTEMW
ncbi:MAG TPA: AAA family ATPase [Pirellulaceae bacterium]|nr:AAA family ATPase [Pirellulaceae bacterium]